MLQAGKNITTAGDTLQKVPVEYLYNAIKKPKPDVANRIKQLRIVRNIDTKQYAMLKKQLPYLVCGIFNPAVRRTENFAYAAYFMLDIDHIAEKGLDVKTLRQRLEADSRVMLSFLSPSQDGLKLLFKLTERCYDAGIYSLFYKLFATDFSKQYAIDQVVDTRTSDVTRACFISYDENAYYNPMADAVNLNAYVNTLNPHAMLLEKKKIEKAEKEQQSLDDKEKPPKTDVDNEVVQRVKEILLKIPPKAAKPPVYVPEQLNDTIGDLSNYISQTGIEIKEIINISYGKKIRAKIGLKEAEVNIFYGKRGFSVVQSPRTGTSADMNRMLADLIEGFLLTR